MDQRRPRTVGVRQRLFVAPQSGQGPHHRLHEHRVATAEPVDRLLDIAHPHDVLGETRELQEQGELDRTRILKFIDHQKIKFIPKGFAHLRVIRGALDFGAITPGRNTAYFPMIFGLAVVRY
jgi:hypothetical protein